MGQQRVLVLYESRTGFTARYAQWLAQALEGTAQPLTRFRPVQLASWDLVLCGGRVCGSELGGIRQFRRLQRRYPETRFAFFAVGLRPASDQTVSLLRAYNFSFSPQSDLYYLQGGLDLERLEPAQKTLLTCFKAMLKRRGALSQADQLFLQRLQTSGDYCTPAQLSPLIAFSEAVLQGQLTGEGDAVTHCFPA